MSGQFEPPPSSRGTELNLGALLWTERTTWKELRQAALAVERSGFDSIWFSDHLLAATGDQEDSCFEAWTTLAAIGALTSRPTIGLLVGAVGLRNPGVVAKAISTLDHLTDGRAVLGLGSGWLRHEYQAHGITWEERPADRADRLEEAIQIVVELLAGNTVSYQGRYYQFTGARHSPRPLQAKIPLLIGGEGRRTLMLVARYADMWNGRGGVDELKRRDQVLQEHCVRLGRPPEDIERLTNRWVSVRSSDREAERALQASLARHGIFDHDPGIVALGPPEEVADQLRPTLNAGFRHILCSLRSPFDHESIEGMQAVREILVERSKALQGEQKITRPCATG